MYLLFVNEEINSCFLLRELCQTVFLVLPQPALPCHCTAVAVKSLSYVLLEIHDQAYVQLSSGQIIGDRILDIVHVGDPIVGADVLDVQKVEYIQS